MCLGYISLPGGTRSAAARRSQSLANTLRHPERALIVDVPLEMDDGTIRHFEGFRVQHNLSRGPGKGGVRYHPDVSLQEVMALAA
ncbi:Glu/Leu/Phe/Val dehydrogenase [Klebsiella aerogenes]|nr:Glu/Leu/Phe/Val dehydrogenase [Klebsiella aerogenes]